ncbi:MAG: DEAD/DEAH box helicase, partial [Chloroflexota bacterium]
MRIYAPAGTVETLDRLLSEPEIAEAVVTHRVLPEREAQVAPFPDWLDKRLVRGLHAQGIEMLYTHQAEALDALHEGKDIVVVTPTASGKTLCYGLPVLQAVAEDPSARALFLFPTKALSQDQLAAFRELADKAEMEVVAGV